ncbi:unnamed protein product, partial [Closterium sp. NIES-65]
VFLRDCQKAWGKAVQSWVVGADCFYALGLFCDDTGMISQISYSAADLKGIIPDSISSLAALSVL